MIARFVTAALAATLAALSLSPAQAGTTGGLRGQVVDQATGTPISGATVAVVSPSQEAQAKTDASGSFALISLAPDTYTVSISYQGYDSASLAGVTVTADQVQNLPRFALVRSLTTIARVNSTPNTAIVKPGTTSDVYSVDATKAAAVAAVGGPGGLNQAYSAIATVPGANLPQGQQGWNQLVYIRGGDYSDVANELDGVPVQRASDYAPISTLSSLGQQEVQTYTGGTPPSAEASGLSGYINQVIKTGTYPGYSTLDVGVGAPAFYHKLSFEIGGATRNRLFSYYVGTSGVNQDYRYSNQFNGAGNPLFFAPLGIPTGANGAVYDGSLPAQFSPGQNYAIANTNDRETVANFHFGIPHKHGLGRDDVQLLYVNSEIFAQFYSSLNDLGGLALTSQVFNAAPTYTDGQLYQGPLFAPPDPTQIVTYLQPSSPANRTPFASPLDPNLRDGNDNGMSLVKLQYQRNINDHSYLRAFAYSEYTNWFINGPVSAYFNYSGELQDYEVNGHTFGGNLVYSNQINDKNLITATASYQTQKLETYSGNTFGIITTNLVDANGNCYNPTSGAYASCYTPITFDPSGNPQAIGGLLQYQQFGFPIGCYNGGGSPFVLSPGQSCLPTPFSSGNPAIGNPAPSLTLPITAPAGSPALANNAQWLVTNNGSAAQVDRITPFFSSVSLADEFRPNDRLTINAGARIENFLYRLNDTAGGFPARQFWFNAYNREYCFTPGSIAPFLATSGGNFGVDPATGASLCPAGTNANLQNTSPSTVSFTAFEPRFGLTFAANRDTVIRASAGRYAAPSPTSYQQYDVVQQDLPSFIGQFLPYGFNTPFHQSRPSYSNNFDLSLEKHLKGTDISFKLTPFYRNTQDQLQNIPIGAQGVLDGLNTGSQRNEGVEFELQKGDFSHDGLAFLLSYTYTHSRIHFNNFANGLNVIDVLNSYIQQYNSYTSACAGATVPANVQQLYTSPCGAYGSQNAQATFSNSGTTVANPYYNRAAQPLFDRTGEYTPYDILPAPYQGANGYETPNVATLVVNYKHNRLSLTPSLTYSSGAFYGSPLQWSGPDPSSCTGALASGAPDPTTCSDPNGPIFLPDPFNGNKFDGFGAFREPTRVTANMQIGYAVSPRAKLTLTMTGLVDHCYQRGYAWDNASTCVYAHLPSNKLAPIGEFGTNATNPIPVQLQYPYSSWYNNSQTGYVGQTIPFAAFLSLELKL